MDGFLSLSVKEVFYPSVSSEANFFFRKLPEEIMEYFEDPYLRNSNL